MGQQQDDIYLDSLEDNHISLPENLHNSGTVSGHVNRYSKGIWRQTLLLLDMIHRLRESRSLFMPTPQWKGKTETLAQLQNSDARYTLPYLVIEQHISRGF